MDKVLKHALFINSLFLTSTLFYTLLGCELYIKGGRWIGKPGQAGSRASVVGIWDSSIVEFNLNAVLPLKYVY